MLKKMMKEIHYNIIPARLCTNASEGVICGANIKPIKIKEKAAFKYGEKVKKTSVKWGIFIHIKLNDGYQLDAVWNLTKTFTDGNGSIPLKVNRKKKKDFVSRGSVIDEGIPFVLRACGVNEWVELIGTKVKVRDIGIIDPSKKGFIISPMNDDIIPKWFYPNYFDYYKF